MDILSILIGTTLFLFIILIVLAGILAFQKPLPQRHFVQKDLQKIKDQIVSPDKKRKQKGFYSTQVREI
jgi:hypothetical protein